MYVDVLDVLAVTRLELSKRWRKLAKGSRHIAKIRTITATTVVVVISNFAFLSRSPSGRVL
jgi:hypothetical protein